MYLIVKQAPQPRCALKKRQFGGKTCRAVKNRRKFLLKMLAVMEAGAQSAGPSSVSGSSAPNEPPIKEFLSSGRTGRRNALPDILGQHAVVTSSDLPSRLQALTTKDSNSSHLGEPQPGPSSAKS